MSDFDSQTFTVAQVAADHLHCSRRFVDKLMAQGRIGYSKVGAKVIITGRNIRDLLETNARPPKR